MDKVPFVSYSANFEDVILNRIFCRQQTGFYVDIGAAHPIFENDTKALSERGWSGINVEPQPQFFAALRDDRSRDVNIQAAVSDKEGQCEFYEIVGTGLSTCDYEQARRSASADREIRQYTVPSATLASILEQASAPSRIDLLKVDVEGFEAKVLIGNDWIRFRPKVLVIEATYPETPVRRDAEVKAIVESAGYRLAYFDGLNDFFVERDFEIAADLFLAPPNIFDNFITYEVQQLRKQRTRFQDQILELTNSIAEATQYASSLKQARDSAELYAQSLEQALADERSNAPKESAFCLIWRRVLRRMPYRGRRFIA